MWSLISKTLRNFVGDNTGSAGIEFALIAPILAAALVLSADVGMKVMDRSDMQSAVRTGAQYLMDGGRDMNRMNSLVAESWTSKPGNASVVGERYCNCAAVIHACTTLCGDGTVPESHISINATATVQGILSQSNLAASETVRIR